MLPSGPTVLPTDNTEEAPSVVPIRGTHEPLTVVTGPPEKVPTILPKLLVSDVATMGPSAPEIYTSPAMAADDTETEAYVAASTTIPERFVTPRLSMETVAPAAATEEARADVTVTVETKPKNGVVIDEGTNETSGERRFPEANKLSCCMLLLE